MRILIIEDEKNLAIVLKKGLEENSYTVDLSHDGEDGLFAIENYSYDAIILDVMLPKIDGFTVLKILRAKEIDVPVLMLTAKSEIEDKIDGLNRGADDYITKPFNFSELLARLKAIIRRNKGKASAVLTVDDLTLNTNSRTVMRGVKEIKLSSKEYNILEYLVLNKDKVITRTELIDHIYDMDFDLDSNVIDVYINYLRSKVDKDFDKKLIHTVRGSGYILKESS
ncbi:MAG: response regulator transcription factor [Spirochaetota bacterium]|nr:response regulator transcription factor [Spirochaetota bacterium]